MKGFVSVMGREVRERWLIPVAALGAGLLALAAPLLPALRFQSAEEARAAAAIIFAVAFGLGCALMLGGSILATDLFERRLAFYLSRPLSTFSIWSGKMAAALGLAVASALLALTPAALSGASLREAVLGFVPGRRGLLWLAAALLLVPLAHVGVVILRSRSPLLLVDLLVLAAAALVARTIFVGFFLQAALAVILVSLSLVMGGIAAGVLAAGPIPVAAGRTDLRKVRWAVSLTLWAGVAAGTGAAFLWTLWVRSAGPRDLAVQAAYPAPAGNWIEVWGRAAYRAGYSPSFLVNSASLAGWRVPAGSAGSVFSRDGRRAAWLEAEHPRQTYWGRLVIADLDHELPMVRRTSVFATVFAGLLLDDSGSKVVLFRENGLSVFDRSGRELISVRREGIGQGTKATFLPDGRLRVWVSPSWSVKKPLPVEVLEVDLARKKVSLVGRSEPVVVRGPLLADAAGERFLLRTDEDVIELRDGTTAELIRAIAAKRADGLSADFLTDGRVAAVRAAEGALFLRLFTRDGLPTGEIFLGRGRSASVSGIAAPGILLATVADEDVIGRSSPTRVIAVNLETEVVQTVARSLHSPARLRRFLDRDATRVAGPGTPVSRLFYGPAGSLVRLDPISGKTVPILPGNPRAVEP